MKFTFSWALHCHRHLVCISDCSRDIFHNDKLYIPKIGCHFGTINMEAVSCIELKWVTIGCFVWFPSKGFIFGEVLAGYSGISHFAIGIWLIANEFEQPSLRLLRVPGECVTINAESGISGWFHIFLNRLEVHIAVAVYDTTHFHGVAGYGLGEVLVVQVSDLFLIEIIGNSSTSTEFEVGVLRSVDVLFQSFVLIEVTIVRVARFSQLEFFLRHSRNRQAGSKH